MKRRILLFGGTTEGRELTRFGLPLIYSVATAYGAELVRGAENTEIAVGRMDAAEMEKFIRESGIACVSDATHPYAREARENIRAACAASGTPLMHDFAVISLSDLLTPWELIEKRLRAAAEADFVICGYNPASRGRPGHLARAAEILMERLPRDRAAGWVRNAGRDGESFGLTTLAGLKEAPIDMFCTVIIGNSATRVIDGRLITPRGYKAPAGGED